MMTNGAVIAAGNEGQARAWDGDEGAVWARHPEFFELSVREHQARLMAAASIGADESVLDIGCGTGDSTLAAATAASSGRALGIDLSSRMLAHARDAAVSRGVTNATFVQGDAQIWPFDAEAFDIAISRTGSMFFADQSAAFANVARALRPGGRLVLISWQGPERNEWFRCFVDAMTLGRGLAAPPPDAPSPFAHADPVRTTEVLADAGFSEVRCEPIELPMYFGSTVDEGFAALSELLAWMASDAGAADRESAFERLRDSLEEHLTHDGVSYGSGVWLVTAVRRQAGAR